ncbi:DUF3035 domain-containing protein [Rhodovibrio salinarum]|uniref:DUF3035 domain-containing protein n=1 Tax=Rhodovibrio salinarum TaxID=1087 RepID=A0A934V197_9PROT|nr:DUF3035 domain-containing protein [Rhodovibrio salinarum]MBK1699192.1 DUF3035 domain-containing protein [Rhodovibrio salinarum]
MTHRRPIRLVTVLLLALPALAGCSDSWRTSLGLKQTAPDEFKVAEHEPLEMPPSLSELPPPRAGGGRPQATSPRVRAQQALLASPATGQEQPGMPGGRGGLSDGEQRLLANANAGAAPADIRQTVAREAAERAEDLQGPLDDYIFWRDPEQPGEVVDAQAEARRLRENRAQGKPLEDGEVPIQEREDRGILGGL